MIQLVIQSRIQFAIRVEDADVFLWAVRTRGAPLHSQRMDKPHLSHTRHTAIDIQLCARWDFSSSSASACMAGESGLWDYAFLICFRVNCGTQCVTMRRANWIEIWKVFNLLRHKFTANFSHKMFAIALHTYTHTHSNTSWAHSSKSECVASNK